MNFNLPFYEKKGTIKKIDENDNFYLVYYYGFTPKEETLIAVQKNTKNFNSLCDNYYNDLKGYLEKNSVKYETYKYTKRKKIVNSKLIDILNLSTIILIGMSIPLLLNPNALFFLGITLNAISVPILLTSIKLSKEEKDDREKADFINKYNELEHRLRLYNQEKKQTKEETKYNGLTAIPDSNIRDLKITKEKKKVA